MKFSEVGKGTYAGARFTEETLDLLQDLQEIMKVPNPVPRDKMHTTICFSRRVVNYIPKTEEVLVGNTGVLKVFKTSTGKNALVVTIESDYLKDRHDYSMALGATYDFPDYIPHVTLSYDIGPIDFSNHGVYGNPISISTEYVSDLDLDWSDKN